MVLLDEKLYSAAKTDVADLSEAGEIGNEVRLYMVRELVLGEVQDIQAQLEGAGVSLREPVAYAARIVAIRYNLPALEAVSWLELPCDVYGWQVFGESQSNYVVPAVMGAVIAIAAVGASRWGKKKLKVGKKEKHVG